MTVRNCATTHLKGLNASEVISNEYWIQCNYLLKIAGLWPYQKKYINILIRVIITMGIYSMMIPQMARGILEIKKNKVIVLENTAGFFYFITALSLYYRNILCISKLQYLYEEITKDWYKITDENEKNILKHYANQGRWITNFYSVYVYMAGMLFPLVHVIMPIIADFIKPLNETRPRHLCYYAEYFFIDQEKHLYPLILHTVFAVLCTVIIFSAVHETYISAAQHSVAHFYITEYQLNQALILMEKNAHRKLEEIENITFKCVRTSVRSHLRSLQFVEHMQTAYSISLFLNITCTLIGIVTGIPVLMITKEDLANFIRICLVFIASIITLFFINWPGQKVYDSSSYIYTATYSCGWYRLPIKTQKLIKFMMLRASKPSFITAGPLMNLNFQTFSEILKTAASYITAILTMTQET